MKEGESRTYIVPLRKAWLKVPKWRRSKRAVAALRNFILRHAKTKEVKIGKWLNEALWARGAKNPPAKITISVKKEKEVAKAELAVLPPRAKRLAEKTKARAEERKKKEAERKAKEEEKKKKTEEHKKKKSEEKKEIEKVKEAGKKAPAKMTKKQEIELHKKK